MKKKLNCILLIDDDEPTNYISKFLIEEADCTEHIHIVQTGQSALDYLTNDNIAVRPDLIFLDINMPAMNGWEFLDKYNKLEQKHKEGIVIVMLTTSLNPDDEIKASEMPCIAGFENKPLTSEKLDRVLKEYFPSYFF
ncbi:MAG: response regulator [Chitinophagaceae bacterium]